MNTKIFLTYTAIIEALSGVFLIIMPSNSVMFFFGEKLNSSAGIIFSMWAGAAIFSIAILLWQWRNRNFSPLIFLPLFLYNFLLSLIVIYGAKNNTIHGTGLWIVLIFHSIQTVICAGILLKRKIKFNT
jgi:hypothetical protein